jgi:hypothetical protein
MSNKKTKLVGIIKEIIKREVQKEVKKIFIDEGIIKPKKSTVSKEEVSYTKNPTLNKILNETAQQNSESEEYPTMGGGTFDTSKMSTLLGYGGAFADPEAKRQSIGISTAQAAGVNPDSVPVEVMNALTKDYSGVMKALNKKDGIQ